MGSRSPIDILLEDDNENKIKRRNTRIIYLWLYSTWLIVLSHIRLYAPRQSTSCLYMIHYGLSVALLFALLTVHIPPGIFESVLHTHHIFVRFAYFTASKIFTIPIIPSVVAKKRIEYPDSKYLCISIHYLLVSIGF